MHSPPTRKDSLRRIGFGTYRVDASHRAALDRALDHGLELIDTSTNYGFGASERAVGEALAARPGHAIRVISKAGYVQGPLLKEAGQFKEVTSIGPDLAHCIHPEFILRQLDRSRERLGQPLDSYLLHNPEYFLKKTPDPREYYARIERAFRALEDAVEEGKIRSYGISSNSLIEDQEHPEHTSLAALLDIRERIAAEKRRPSHFRYVQFPLNLFESEAAAVSNQGTNTVLELAARAGLLTLANRPLNAFTRKHLVRLASFRHHHHVDFRQFLSRIFDDVNGLEARCPAEAGRPVFWGHLLRENFRDLVDLEQWRNFLNWRIRPSVLELESKVCATPAGMAWWKEYEPRLEGLLQAIDSFMENAVAERSERLRVRLIEAAPALRSSPTLSQAALRVYLALPGLNWILLGMRRPIYVDDAMAAGDAVALTPEAALNALDAARQFLAEFEQEDRQ